MRQTNTERLRNTLRTVVDDVEQVLQTMSENTGAQASSLRTRAGRQLHDARSRLSEAERLTSQQMRRAGRETQGYVKKHPWQAVGSVAAVAFALAMLSRRRTRQ